MVSVVSGFFSSFLYFLLVHLECIFFNMTFFVLLPRKKVVDVFINLDGLIECWNDCVCKYVNMCMHSFVTGCRGIVWIKLGQGKLHLAAPPKQRLSNLLPPRKLPHQESTRSHPEKAKAKALLFLNQEPWWLLPPWL